MTVTSLATGVVTKVTTNDNGTYLVLNMLPGEYLVQAKSTGFQRFEQTVSVRDRLARRASTSRCPSGRSAKR